MAGNAAGKRCRGTEQMLDAQFLLCCGMNFQKDFVDPSPQVLGEESEPLFPEFILAVQMFRSELGLGFQRESRGGGTGVFMGCSCPSLPQDLHESPTIGFPPGFPRSARNPKAGKDF